MRRVVVTGMGIVSSIGNTTDEVLESLRTAKSGIDTAQDYVDLGFRCQVHGMPTVDVESLVDRRNMRFHGGGTAWNHIAMDQAIADAGLAPEDAKARGAKIYGELIGYGRLIRTSPTCPSRWSAKSRRLPRRCPIPSGSAAPTARSFSSTQTRKPEHLS